MKDFTIAELAKMIKKDWGDEITPHASDYLESMLQLNNNHLEHSSEDIILKFLCNAVPWRGDLARMIKRELNRRLNEKQE